MSHLSRKTGDHWWHMGIGRTSGSTTSRPRNSKVLVQPYLKNLIKTSTLFITYVRHYIHFQCCLYSAFILMSFTCTLIFFCTKLFYKQGLFNWRIVIFIKLIVTCFISYLVQTCRTQFWFLDTLCNLQYLVERWANFSMKTSFYK